MSHWVKMGKLHHTEHFRVYNTCVPGRPRKLTDRQAEPDSLRSTLFPWLDIDSPPITDRHVSQPATSSHRNREHMNLRSSQEAAKRKHRRWKEHSLARQGIFFVQIFGQELLTLTGLFKMALADSSKKIWIDCHEFVCMSGLQFALKDRTIIIKYGSNYSMLWRKFW